MNRRYFFMSTAAAVATRACARKTAPNETVRIAVVGNGGRGASHMGAWTSLPNVELAAWVDVDSNQSENTSAG
jgi:hypothetical protein